MKLESTAFENNGTIPSKYTCDGVEVSPPLRISGVPENAKTLALIVDDPDAPNGTFLHWMVWNISPDTADIDEDTLPEGAREGQTGFDEVGYGGPCPPDREHRYYFKLYALDKVLDIPEGADLDTLQSAIEHHVIEEAELIGRYDRRR
ncbi:MAG: hypothetical protein A3J48_01540 [Candidatus Doudnabacteria bacterium RIFCSPHIGHO2_02_FULL_46_11]|uniref:Phosphatidylethanolamine-binding protein n=1 Tax=Candidatus Doudnabacteria bacterium RIFCSPHIGHO2_02_FULL_46_11 TaxID=1817832 RepID=A0A1F5P9K1_9BACT|nr:MAG: hypothetical protein A3J48_01540 [Candidatus Doudnabacteria bacterium RIFCSPHIGHO2_02_FULL_46_11]